MPSAGVIIVAPIAALIFRRKIQRQKITARTGPFHFIAVNNCLLFLVPNSFFGKPLQCFYSQLYANACGFGIHPHRMLQEPVVSGSPLFFSEDNNWASGLSV